MLENHQQNTNKSILMLVLLLCFCQCFTFSGLMEEGKKMEGVSHLGSDGKFRRDIKGHADITKTDRKCRICNGQAGNQPNNQKLNKNQQKLNLRDNKNWGPKAARVTQSQVNQTGKQKKQRDLLPSNKNEIQRRRLTSTPITVNNYFPNSVIQISSPSFPQIPVHPPSPPPSAYNQIVYTEYLKNNFPAVPSQQTSPVNFNNFKPDLVINSIFNNIMKDLQYKFDQNTPPANKIQSQTNINIQAETKTSVISNTPNTTPLSQIARPTLAAQINSFPSNSLPPLPEIQVSFSNYLNACNPFFFVKSTPDIYYYREKIFMQFLQYINNFNKRQNRTFNMGLNQFTYLTQTQFNDRYLKKISPEILPTSTNPSTKSTQKLPNISIDWRCKASAVVVASQCIISHILSVFQAIQITQNIYNIGTAELSTQQILSCGTDTNLKGCDGGYYSAVYNYVQIFGVGLNRAYPFEDKARVNKTISECSKPIINNKQYTKNKIFVTTGRIKSGDCEEVVKQLQKRAISVMIASKDLRFYKNGTYNSVNIVPDHKVTLVGYDPDNKFMIKNVWGAQWGIQGYAYVSQNTGICNHAMYPILEKQGEILPCQQ